MDQLVLPGELEREAGIRRVTAGNSEWLRAAMNILPSRVPAGEFTSEDLWDILEEHGVPPPREGRAMGAVLRRLSTRGLIRPTQVFVPSTRKTTHRTPIRVWQRAA